jgi:hypothetical protein
MSFLAAEGSGSSASVTATTLSKLLGSTALTTRDFTGSGAGFHPSGLQKTTVAGTFDNNPGFGGSVATTDHTKPPTIVAQGH